MREQRVPACKNFRFCSTKASKRDAINSSARNALLLKPVDIGFREYAALAGNGVEANSLIVKPAEIFERDADLHADLIDDRTCAAGALSFIEGVS